MSLTMYQLVKTISAAIFITVCCCSPLKAAKVKPSKLYRQNRDMLFKGRVKSVQDINFKYNPADSVALGHFHKEHFKYDRAGNLVERIIYLKDGKFSSRSVFRYDKAGNYIEWGVFSEDGSLKRKDTYQYDKDGNMIKKVEYGRSDSLSRTQNYYYDEYGSMIELCSEPESFHTNNSYSYDSLNRPLTRERMDVYTVKRRDKAYPGFIIYKYSYTYKYSGDTLEETVYDYRPKGYTTTVLNKNNRVLARRGSSDYEKPFDETFKYDASGNNIIEYKEVKDGVIDDKRSYRCEYVYDKKGNWIKKTTTSLDGKPRSSVERRIEYY